MDTQARPDARGLSGVVRTTYEQPSAAEVGTIALRWVNVAEGARFAVGDEARVSLRTASPGRQGRG